MQIFCTVRWLAGAGVALTMAGCSMPPQMRIENANHPSYEDQDVRFRATYYFRVFDHCPASDGGQPPAMDTLYRFRMTGKANSLTTQVHFESGTLTASQIDPLGATVAYDERNRQFYFKSQGEGQADALRERRFADLNRLIEQYRTLPDLGAASTADATKPNSKDPLKTAFQDVIVDRINSLKEGLDVPKATVAIDELAAEVAKDVATPPTAASAAETAAKAASAADARAKAIIDCQKGRRGFQILGPEGWRTFNQDERLLLAMSSSGKPLISTMQEISGRILNSQPIESEILLPLVREDLRISHTQRELERYSPSHPEQGGDLLKNAISELTAKDAK